MTTRVEVFVDYVCPFCFLVEGALDELVRERDIELEIRPFELRPDPVPTLKPEDDYLPAIWDRAVYPMARRVGMDITLPTISPQPRTDKAFMVLQLANEHGLAELFSRRMFEAFFQQDRNIGDDQVIVDVAQSAGLSRKDTEEALRSTERRERQNEDQRFAAETIGISAVPSFRVNGRVVSGVLNASQLKDLVDSAAEAGARL